MWRGNSASRAPHRNRRSDGLPELLAGVAEGRPERPRGTDILQVHVYRNDGLDEILRLAKVLSTWPDRLRAALEDDVQFRADEVRIEDRHRVLDGTRG